MALRKTSFRDFGEGLGLGGLALAIHFFPQTLLIDILEGCVLVSVAVGSAAIALWLGGFWSKVRKTPGTVRGGRICKQ